MKFINANDTRLLQQLWEAEQTFGPRSKLYIGSTSAILSILVILVNLLYLHGLCKTNKRFSQMQKTFVYLTCIDLIGGFLAFSLISAGQFYGQPCDYQTFMMAIIGYVSTGDATTMVIISILRLHSILRPLNRNHFPNLHFAIVIQNVVLVSVMATFVIIYKFATTLVNFQIVCFVALTTLTMLDSTILSCVLVSLRALRNQKQSGVSHFSRTVMQKDKKSAKTLLIIGICMSFCLSVQVGTFSFLFVILTKGPLRGETFLMAKLLFDVTQMASILNTGLNSMVLIARNKRILKFYKDKFDRQQQNDSSLSTSQ